MANLTAEKAQQVISGWQSLQPKKPFAGLTVDKFISLVETAREADAEVASLETKLGTARDQRDKDWDVVNEKIQMVISAVKGDPDEGLDGDLVQAMGYKRSSERKAGGPRRQTPPAAPTKQAA